MNYLFPLIAWTFPLVGRLLRSFDPETAHTLTIRSLAAGLVPGPGIKDRPELAIRLWRRDFSNPLGMAAGFDKDGCVIDPLLRLGFGFVEAGTVTPRPQIGNPRPRLFRLPELEAVINRMGFNSRGLDLFAAGLSKRRDDPRRAAGIVAVNIGRNKDTDRAVDDYVVGIRRLAAISDMMVINVSSPNTPGLRALQGREPLKELLVRALAARRHLELPDPPPLLVKIAPDLTEDEKEDIAALALETGIDGLVVSNTTIARPPEIPENLRLLDGGLSGRPLFAASTKVLRDMYRLTGGKIPLVGVGGVSTADDAYAKIRAGASLVELYTSLIYRGPAVVSAIKKGIVRRLEADGFRTLAEAVGADHRQGPAERSEKES